ncbi:MAG: hypothetical protein AAGD92_07150 [Pseudomonadota bacterium]
MTNRLHILLSDDTAKLLEGACLQTGATKTALVESAITELLAKKTEKRELEKITLRLDKMSKAVERLAGDAAAHTETLALYILYYLCITPPVPEASRGSMEALGRKRFELFIAQVGDRLMGTENFGDALLSHIGLERVATPDAENADASPSKSMQPKVLENVQ